MSTHRALRALCILAGSAAAATATAACDTADPTYAVAENAYPDAADGGDPSQRMVVYKVWWVATLFAEPIARALIELLDDAGAEGHQPGNSVDDGVGEMLIEVATVRHRQEFDGVIYRQHLVIRALSDKDLACTGIQGCLNRRIITRHVGS